MENNRIAFVEPVFNCPSCGVSLQTEWVDNGFGPYSVQASPYHCECGWSEIGCSTCIKEKCFSWDKCKGRALIERNTETWDGPQIQNSKEEASFGDEVSLEEFRKEWRDMLARSRDGFNPVECVAKAKRAKKKRKNKR